MCRFLDTCHGFDTQAATRNTHLYRLVSCLQNISVFTSGRDFRERQLTEKHAISIAVLTGNQDDVENVNSSLRDAGHAAHCQWVETPGRFADILGKSPPELIIVNVDTFADTLRQVIKQKDSFIPEVPVIAIAEDAAEDRMLAAMKDGACDLV